MVRILNTRNLQPQDGNDRDAYMRITGGPAQYFLLISQDVGYIWNEQKDTPAQLDMAAVMRRFIPTINSGYRMFGVDLAELVSFWLTELATGLGGDEEPERTLAGIGFLAQVRGSTVYSGTAV